MITVVIVAYIVISLCAYAWQRRLLYLPTKIPAEVIESVAGAHGFAPWKNAAGQTVGWKVSARGTATASVLIMHGNAGCALGRPYIAQPIHAAGPVEVFVLEYPGYGARPGSPSQASFLAAAKEALNLLPAGRPKYVVSESIGAGAACELAKNHPSEIAGLALLVPFHNLAAVAQRRMWFLPAYFLLRDRFHPADALKQYRGPVKFLVAGADEIIGPASGIRLHQGYAGPKELQVIPGARHNDVASQLPEWWREVFAFWENNQR